MDYPNGFNIKSFPAGKTIAFSRAVSIWISIIFFLIIAFCGFLLLGIHFKKNYPFLISIDPFTEEWTVVTYPGKGNKESVPQYQIIQEKLVHDFVNDWFTISKTNKENDERWKSCDVENCAQPEQFNPNNTNCAISCKSDAIVFKEFESKVLPQYQKLEQTSAQWNVASMLITPINIEQMHGAWQVFITVNSTKTGAFNVLTFITVENNQNMYPATLGYHITEFNSYRMTNE